MSLFYHYGITQRNDGLKLKRKMPLQLQSSL